MIVCGVDPSLSQTALVIGSGPSDFKVFNHRSKPLGTSPAARVARYDRLVAEIMVTINANRPDRIFIEGYSYGSKFARETLGEFGGILRWMLVDIDPLLTEIQPSSLKKFVTGKGAGQKDQMMLGVYRNWGYEPHGNDDADAFGLWKMGLCICGQEQPTNQAQREAVGKVAFL